MRKSTEIEICNMIREEIRSSYYIKEVIDNIKAEIARIKNELTDDYIMEEYPYHYINTKMDTKERLKRLEELTKAKDYEWQTETKLVKKL